MLDAVGGHALWVLLVDIVLTQVRCECVGGLATYLADDASRGAPAWGGGTDAAAAQRAAALERRAAPPALSKQTFDETLTLARSSRRHRSDPIAAVEQLLERGDASVECTLRELDGVAVEGCAQRARALGRDGDPRRRR